MIPHGSDNYLITHIRPNPDLYGPFWVCVTLVFSIAISENVANYLQTASSTKYHWRYDFHVVSYAATFISLYVWLLPLALWGALKWTNSSRNTEEELIEVCYRAFFFALSFNVGLFTFICFPVLRSPKILRTFVFIWLFLKHLYPSSFPMDNPN